MLTVMRIPAQRPMQTPVPEGRFFLFLPLPLMPLHFTVAAFRKATPFFLTVTLNEDIGIAYFPAVFSWSGEWQERAFVAGR